jgi:hypothetical protein
MLNSRTIQGILTLIIGTFLAIWLGLSIVTNQIETLIQFGGVGLLLVCVLLGRRIWLLMILLMAMNIPLIRGFGTAELGQALFLGFSTIMILMKRFNARIIITELEWWMIAVALTIVQVYARNPVGIQMLGGTSVGGKAYFLTALAFCAAMVFATIRVPPNEMKWALYLDFFGRLIGIPIGELRNRAGLASMEAAEMGPQKELADPGAATRIGLLGGIASVLSTWISSRVNPLKACFHPLWAPLILISLAAAAGSGFRNTIANVGMIYLVGIAYRGGILSLFLAAIAGAMGIAALSFFNLMTPLPANIQRALTPFPGSWEQRYKDDAKGSDEWRVEMWKEALFTDRWIENKWLGDGLGMSDAELRRGQELATIGARKSLSGITLHQENAMLSGDYHSGPVQTVRIVGYVGLLVLVAAMIRVAVHAHRQILRSRGTEWFPLALYFGIPPLVAPAFFLFIIGDFGRAAATLFISAAMLRVIENNLPLPVWRKSRHEPYVLKQQRTGPVVTSRATKA